MKARAVGVLLAATALAAVGCQQAVEGTGVVMTDEREVSGFNTLSMSVPGTVNVLQGDREYVTIEGDDNIVPLIETVVRGGTLHIRARKEVENASLRPSAPLRIRVGALSLFAVDVSGSGDVVVPALDGERFSATVSGSGNVQADGLSTLDTSVTISGSGNVILSGKAIHQTVTISGSGAYEGRALETKHSEVTVSGSGSALVHAVGVLDAVVSGSGGVRYVGEPTVESSVSGTGDVRPLRG
jgi:hypothetical protein